MRERRLNDVELFSGAREVTVPRHGLDAPELPYVHGNDRRARSLR
jgi:hypothetical protein